MKICFIVDARSPIAYNWIKHFIERQHDVSIVSTHPCSPDIFTGVDVYQVPVAFSNLFRATQNPVGKSLKVRSSLKATLKPLLRYPVTNLSSFGLRWFYPLEIYRHVQRVGDLIARIAPDIVHAMRIPFEGILAGKATPVKISGEQG